MAIWTDEQAVDRSILNHLAKAKTEILRVEEPNSFPSIRLALEELHAAVTELASREGVRRV